MKTKFSTKPPKPVKRWIFDPTKDEPEELLVTMRVVPPNTYWFQGKKQITLPVFFSKAEAVFYRIIQLDAQIAKEHQILGHLLNKRGSLSILLTHVLDLKTPAK